MNSCHSRATCPGQLITSQFRGTFFASSIAQHRNCFNCRHHWVAKKQRALIGMWKRLSTWACNQMAISFEERWARGSCGHWMLEDAHHLGNGQTRQLFSIDLFVCFPVPTCCTSGPLGTMIATHLRERTAGQVNWFVQSNVRCECSNGPLTLKVSSLLSSLSLSFFLLPMALLNNESAH